MSTTDTRWVDEGRFLRFWKPRSQGGRYRILSDDIEQVRQAYLGGLAELKNPGLFGTFPIDQK